jgi:AcrR family transcriptional regulator
MGRPPKGAVGLTTERILQKALEIADREGQGALSMRRLGDELGCAAMSLYEYVDSKNSLIELMADHALKSLPVPDGRDAWRLQVIRFFTALYELFLTHPSVAHLIVDRAIAGPTAIRTAEPVLAALIDAGLSDERAVEGFLVMSNYTIGASLYRLARTGPKRDEHDTMFAEISSEQHPTLYRVAPVLVHAPDEEQFHAGLNHLIASYEALCEPVPGVDGSRSNN